MRSKLVLAMFAFFTLYGSLTSCAAVNSVLDSTMSIFDEDTGETVEVTVGDAIADNADGVGGLVSDTLSGVNPLVALLGGGAAAALLGGARRKKKAAALAQAAPPAEEPEVKG